MRPTIAFIGAGKVANTLARLWYKSGYKIASVYSRKQEKALTLAKHTHATVAVSSSDAVQSADLIFLTVSDDAIETLADELCYLNWHGKAVVHTSGAASLDKLSALEDVGAMVGSLHPAFPFADVETAMANLAGSSFAIEARNEQLRIWLRNLVEAIGGQVIDIPDGKKALYHTALVLTSNYTVTLYAVAQNLLKSLSAEQSAIDNALLTLLRATIENIAQQGIPDALTGPLSRADTGTIQSHLEALDDDETLKHAYIALARLSYPMLEQRGINTHIIEEVLQERP